MGNEVIGKDDKNDGKGRRSETKKNEREEQ